MTSMMTMILKIWLSRQQMIVSPAPGHPRLKTRTAYPQQDTTTPTMLPQKPNSRKVTKSCIRDKRVLF